MSSRNPNIPSTPKTGTDPSFIKWAMTISTLLKGAFGTGKDRFLTAQDLIDGGLASDGGNGTVKPPTNTDKPILTKPPTVQNLQARGAFALIILSWDNVAALYANHGYYEIYRADIDDVGQAVKIGTSQTLFYNDAIGEGARKYYWVRAISSSGVAGDFSTSAYGETSYDVEYVMDLLTETVWTPNTVYQPYQYVRPTVENGFTYLCIDGGVSGATEPTWVTTVGATVDDNTVQWRCRPSGEKVPFAIGLVDGVMSVVMNVVYIADASIESAKIKNLIADKILAGKLQVGQDIEVGSAIWSGFSDFFNVGAVAGWWIGFVGGNPAFKIATENEDRYIKFDGVDLQMNVDIISSGDADLDDITCDTLVARRAVSTPAIIYDQRVEPSDYAINLIDIGDTEFSKYLSLAGNFYKTVSATNNGLIGIGGAGLYTETGAGASRGGGVKVVSAANEGIKQFNEPDDFSVLAPEDRYLRFIEPSIGFKMKCDFVIILTTVSTNPVVSFILYNQYNEMIAYCRVDTTVTPNDSTITFYIVDPADGLDITNMHAFAPHDMTPPKHTDTFTAQFYSKLVVTPVLGSIDSHSWQLMVSCQSDNQKLGYHSDPTKRLKGGCMVKAGFYVGSGDDNNVTADLNLDFQLWKSPRPDIVPNVDSEPIDIT